MEVSTWAPEEELFSISFREIVNFNFYFVLCGFYGIIQWNLLLFIFIISGSHFVWRDKICTTQSRNCNSQFLLRKLRKEHLLPLPTKYIYFWRCTWARRRSSFLNFLREIVNCNFYCVVWILPRHTVGLITFFFSFLQLVRSTLCDVAKSTPHKVEIEKSIAHPHEHLLPLPPKYAYFWTEI